MASYIRSKIIYAHVVSVGLKRAENPTVRATDAALAAADVLIFASAQPKEALGGRWVGGRQLAIGGRRRLVLDYDRLAELDESGLTMREIASEMGVSSAFVCKTLKARQRLPVPAFGD